MHDAFKDPQSAWTATGAIAFSVLYGTAAVGTDAPRRPLDLVDPKWKGRIASSFPHDDDAVFSGRKAIGIGTAGSAVPDPSSPVRFLTPGRLGLHPGA